MIELHQTSNTVFYVDEQIPLSLGHEQPARSAEHFASFNRACQRARERAAKVLLSYGDDDLFYEEALTESTFELCLVSERNGTPHHLINVRQSTLAR